MSAFGRLWRRAPAWRFLLILAVASTALAAMFPPYLPSLDAVRSGRRDAAAADPGPRYSPAPDPGPLDYSVIDLPPITGTRSLLIPFAGRQVPLPQGGWTELALMRAGGPQALQAIVLARLRGGRLTGMMIVAGPSGVFPGPAMPANGCFDVKGLPTHDLSSPAGPDGPTQQCWSLRPLVTAQLADPADPNLIEQRSFARLGKIGIEVPVRLLALRYFTEDAAGGLTVTIMEPDPVASAATQRRSEAWMQHWVALLHRGFAGTLRAADVTAALARDPGSADPVERAP